MKLKANDTLHVSSVGPENLQPGEAFEVSDDVGKQLCDRGLATEVKTAKPKAEGEPKTKAEPAPKNKAEPAPDNKGIISGGVK